MKKNLSWHLFCNCIAFEKKEMALLEALKELIAAVINSKELIAAKINSNF